MVHATTLVKRHTLVFTKQEVVIAHPSFLAGPLAARGRQPGGTGCMANIAAMFIVTVVRMHHPRYGTEVFCPPLGHIDSFLLAFYSVTAEMAAPGAFLAIVKAHIIHTTLKNAFRIFDGLAFAEGACRVSY